MSFAPFQERSVDRHLKFKLNSKALIHVSDLGMQLVHPAPELALPPDLEA
jgi:hypothetical protein